MTPASSGNGSVGSPVSATSGRRSPWRAPRKTARVPLAPPSPELTNLGCAFPPFPTTAAKAVSIKSSKSSRHPTRTKPSKSRHQSPSGSSRRSSKQGTAFSSHSRAASSVSSRQRSRSSPWEDSPVRSQITSNHRRPSISSIAPSRKGSANGVPPIPIISPNLTHPTLERAETAPSSSTDAASEAVPPKPGLHRFATAGDITAFAAADLPKREPSYKAKRPPPIVSNIPLSLDGRPDLSKMGSPAVQPPNTGSGLGRRMTKIFGRGRSTVCLFEARDSASSSQ